MLVRIDAVAKELKPLMGSQDTQTLYSGIGLKQPDGTLKWFNCRQDLRQYKGKELDLEFNGNLCRVMKQVEAKAKVESQPIQLVAPSPKVSLTDIEKVILLIARDLNDWVEKTPRGAEAVASVIQTVILRIAAGEVEIGNALADPVPADVKEIYDEVKDWSDA